MSPRQIEEPNLSDLTPYLKIKSDNIGLGPDIKSICFTQQWGVGLDTEKDQLYFLSVYDTRPIGLNVGVYEIPKDETIGRKLKTEKWYTISERYIAPSTDVLKYDKKIPKFTWLGYIKWISTRNWDWEEDKIDKYLEIMVKISNLYSSIPRAENAFQVINRIITAACEIKILDKSIKLTNEHLLGFDK